MELFGKTFHDYGGEEGPVFGPRVLGIWPSQSADSLISLNWVNDAISRWRPGSVAGPDMKLASESWHNEPVEFGVDVARYGSNTTVVVVRRGSRVLQIEAWRGNDLMQSCGKVVLLANHWHPQEIRVDDPGVDGGLTDRLGELGLPVTPIITGAHSPDRRFLNARAYGYWHLREVFRLGNITIPPNVSLQRDLTGLRYEVRSDGKIKIESKEDAARCGIESPDFADALCLAYWPAGVGPGEWYEYFRDREEREQAPLEQRKERTPADYGIDANLGAMDQMGKAGGLPDRLVEHFERAGVAAAALRKVTLRTFEMTGLE